MSTIERDITMLGLRIRIRQLEMLTEEIGRRQSAGAGAGMEIPRGLREAARGVQAVADWLDRPCPSHRSGAEAAGGRGWNLRKSNMTATAF